jgi:hypothetical protein
VRIEGELLECVGFDARDEPQISASGATLSLHRARDELAIRSACGEHRDLDAIDEIVEVVDV